MEYLFLLGEPADIPQNYAFDDAPSEGCRELQVSLKNAQVSRDVEVTSGDEGVGNTPLTSKSSKANAPQNALTAKR
jgi:hypothetical protein